MSGFADSALGLLNDGASLLGFGPDKSEVASSPASQVPASVVNSTQNNQNGGAVSNTFNINGAGDPRAVGSEVARQSGLGAAAQTISPGQRAPRVG